MKKKKKLTNSYCEIFVVWLLQATNNMQLQHGRNGGTRPRLLPLEQRSEFAMLRVWFLQSWSSWRHQERLAQTLCPQHYHACDSHWHLFNWVLCFSEHQKSRNGLPVWRKPDEAGPTQMGLLLVSLTLEHINILFASIFTLFIRKMLFITTTNAIILLVVAVY